MTSDFKARRQALGLSRAELSVAAHVDRRIIQLIELKQLADPEAGDRLTRALDAMENEQPLPNFESELDALKAKTSPYYEN